VTFPAPSALAHVNVTSPQHMRALPILLLALIVSSTAFAQTANWRVYDSLNTPLRSSCIRDLLVDRAGVLWIGTDSGLGRYSDGTWQFIRAHDRRELDSTSGSMPELVGRIVDDGTGGIWVQSQVGEITRLRNGEWRRIIGGWPGSRWRLLAGDGTGGAWALECSDVNESWNCWLPRHLTDTSIDALDTAVPWRFAQLANDRNSAVWFFTATDLWRPVDTTWERVPYEFPPSITAVAFDASNAPRILAGRPDLYEVRDFNVSVAGSGPPARGERDIAVDPTGAVWSGNALEINRLVPGASDWTRMWIPEEVGRFIYHVETTDDSILWVATTKGLLALDIAEFDRTSSIITDRAPTPREPLVPNPAQSVVRISVPAEKASAIDLEVIALADGGVVAREHRELSAGANALLIDVRSLPAGSYLVRSTALGELGRFAIVR
jgi:ligand-binding sensor domain-containing protein